MMTTQSPNTGLASKPLKTFQTPNMALGQKVIRTNPHSLHNPLGGSEIGDSSQAFQTPNMALGQNVIRTNLSSLHNSLRVAQILSVTAGYSQKKKDSVQAVLIQRYTDLPSLRGSVTNSPNSIGSVQRHPDDIGLVQHSNHVNDIHSVDCLALRCLRLISPFTAVTINCALLSPSSRFFSKSATTSCGKRAFSCCDLLLVELVAITESPCGWCDSVYAKINIIKGLRCDSLRCKFKSSGAIHHVATPRSATHTFEASDHNVNRGNSMAMYKSTQTTPEFIQHHSGIFFPNYKPVKINLPLLVAVRYSYPTSAKSEVRGESLNTCADNSRLNQMRFFYVRSYVSMVGRSGGAFALAGCTSAGLSTPLRLITTFESVAVRLQNLTCEATTMVTTLTPSHPKFKWRFFSCQQSRYFTVEARSEQEARSMLPDAPCIFSARFRQGVNHA